MRGIHFALVGWLCSSALAGDSNHQISLPIETTSIDGVALVEDQYFSLSGPKAGDCELPKDRNCETTPLALPNPKTKQRASDMKRTKYDAFIVEAANEWGVHPALLKAQLHAETTIDPLLENEGEKERPIAGYQWGKGLGQFGANNAAIYGLDWYSPKPASEQQLNGICSKLPSPKDASKLQPIWCPRAAIWAKAKYIREHIDRPEYLKVTIRGRANQKTLARIDHLYKRSEVETARYMAGMFNRGTMPLNSIREHFRQTGKLPQFYGVAWSTKRKDDTPAKREFPILNKEFINLCHVFKIAGLCGDEPQGWFKEYSEDFSFDEKLGWRAKYV